MKIFALFFVNVLILSFILAIFEIAIERDKGWGSGFSLQGWGKRMFEGHWIAKMGEKDYFTLYHVAMFGVIVPLVLFGEYLLLLKFIASPVTHINFLGFQLPGCVLQIGELRMVPWLFFIATWLALGVIEDFLWFALNWHYPGSLNDLLAGNIWWHKKYVAIGSIQLPRFYFFNLVFAAVLLAVDRFLSRLNF